MRSAFIEKIISLADMPDVDPKHSNFSLGVAREPGNQKGLIAVAPRQWRVVAHNEDTEATICLLTTGATLSLATQMRDLATYQRHSVASLPLWGMRSKHDQSIQLTESEGITTLEDHRADGCFGSWILESLPAKQGLRDRVNIRALDSVVCGYVGSQRMLNGLGGLA